MPGIEAALINLLLIVKQLLKIHLIFETKTVAYYLSLPHNFTNFALAQVPRLTPLQSTSMAPIIESSDYEYSREEEERQFLRSLESPKLEMASMHPGRSSLGQAGKNSKEGAKARKAEVPSIGDEALPVPSAFSSRLVFELMQPLP